MKQFFNILDTGLNANSLIYLHGELCGFSVSESLNIFNGQTIIKTQAAKNLKSFLGLPDKASNHAAIIEAKRVIKYQPTEELTAVLLAKMPNGKPIKINALIALTGLVNKNYSKHLPATKTHNARQHLKKSLNTPSNAASMEILEAAQDIEVLKKLVDLIMQELKQEYIKPDIKKASNN